MADKSNFTFYETAVTYFTNQYRQSSPVQTISGGTDWKYDVDGTNNYQEISGFVSSNAAIKTDGTLWLWGRGACGALGNNSTANVSSPVQTISGGTNWKQVSSGYKSTAAIKTDGTLWTWGCNISGQLGDNTNIDKSSPVQTVSGGTDWKQVSAGASHIAAIKTDGTLWLWGCQFLGELGDNTRIARSSPVQTVAGGTNWKQVCAGNFVSAAIKTDGTLWMWGAGGCGQLGTLDRFERSSPVQTVSGGTDWKYVEASDKHTAAIKTDGTLWTWGANTTGQLGNNSLIHASSPVQTVAGGTNWKQVSIGFYHTAAVKTDGTLWLWGRGYEGRNGDNTTINRSSPIQTISGGTNWKQVATNDTDIIAVKCDNTLWAWGAPRCGSLGNNVSGLPTCDARANNAPIDFSDVFVRKDYFSEGGLWSWGFNRSSRLGNCTEVDSSSPVQTVSGGTAWKQISAAQRHAIAIKTDGSLWTWGRNANGQLGNGNTIDKSSPVQTVSGGTDWKLAASRGEFSAAIKTDGTLWLWGNGRRGQLGKNGTGDQNSPVQTISGGTNWKQISLGITHTTAIKTDGTLWTWGCNSTGQLGDNTRVDRSSPVQTVSGGTNWKQVAAGYYHTAAIKTDGTLWTWGNGNKGRLGHNAITDRSSPVQTVAGGTDWKQVRGGSEFTGAIKTDGTLWMWGYNGYGQLGNNTRVDRSSPVQTISGGTSWKQLITGDDHAGAIKTDGTLWMWGSNFYGKLGDNTTINRSSPIQTISGGTNWKQASAGRYHSSGIRESC